METPQNYQQNDQNQSFNPSDNGDGQSAEKRNLIVNYLPPSVNQETFRAMFIPYGEVEDSKLMVDKISRRSLGYGFVKFVTPEAAAKAIQALNGQHFEGKTLKVAYSRPASEIQNTNLYIAGLNESVTKSELENTFSAYGTIIDSKILYDKSSGVSRGIGFVRYEQRSSAESAIAALDGNTLAGCQRPLKVKFVENTEKRQRFDPMGGGRFMGYNVGYGANDFYDPSQGVYGAPMQQNMGMNQYPQSYGMPQNNFPTYDMQMDFQQGYMGYNRNQQGFVPRGGGRGGRGGGGGGGYGYNNGGYAPRGMNGPRGGSEGWGRGGGGKFGRGSPSLDGSPNGSGAPSQPGAPGGIRGPTTEYCVFVYNLMQESDENTLLSLFQQFGQIDSVTVLRNDNGSCKGIGFVNFQRLEDAQHAITTMHGYNMGHKPLQVSFKTPKNR